MSQGPLLPQLAEAVNFVLTEGSDQKLEYIFTEVANGAGDHGDFLRKFAQAYNHADQANKGLLKAVSALLVIKYDLMKHLPGKETAHAE